ncbi:MAG: hypothetical protein CMQ49_12110 [Gammaproteobacteria bacterium]|nr:hypothetical protein [Gammaproteobacteria bacterium]
MVETVTGTNRSAGISLEELLPYDTRAVPGHFAKPSPLPVGPTRVPVEAYYSQDYYREEIDKMWLRVWQVACHEDDLPDVGDYTPYEVADRSFVIVKCGPDEYKAFKNACLHRGRMLCEKPGKRARELRCPFHAWAWHLDGTNKEIPCQWDFPGIDPEEQNLTEVPLGRWGRFIFINPDPDCESLEQFLGEFPSHFEKYPYEKRYKVAQVSKVIRANWKVVQDAFAESWHVFSTHPQMVSAFGDPNGQFDAWGNVSRQYNTGGTPSPHLEDVKDWGELEPSESGRPREMHPFCGAIYELREDGNVDVTMPNGAHGVFTRTAEWVEGDLGHADIHLCQWVAGPQCKEGVPVPPIGMATARPMERTLPTLDRKDLVELIAGMRTERAAAHREYIRPLFGDVVDEISDTELTGNTYYNVFPNLMPTPGLAESAIWFRFRPVGMNPEECVMDVYVLAPMPVEGEHPPAPPVKVLDPDVSWTEAEEVGFLARVLDQDTNNMPWVQRGVRNVDSGYVQLADYNETKLRNTYLKLDEYMARP